MSWRCSGASNGALIDNMRDAGLIKSAAVEAAMRATDRGNYTTSAPYQDRPQRIGFSVTISAPHMHAHALEQLRPCLVEGATVLDVGCGSGYLCSCLAHMVGQPGRVIGIDHLQGLTDLSTANISKDDASLLESGRVQIVLGDGWQGHAAAAPYDCIHVGAAASRVPPELVRQLKPGGVMIIPVGPQGGSQHLARVTKDRAGAVTQHNIMGVRYVPLIELGAERGRGSGAESGHGGGSIFGQWRG